MRYSQIREMDISNGEGIGVSLFVQGCHFHCNGCFNKETWDFNGGKEWTEEVKNSFIKLIDRPYIKRISILGGEPLADENCEDVLGILQEIKTTFPGKSIWLYTGYEVDKLCHTQKDSLINIANDLLRYMIVATCDVVVDGRFESDKKDLTLKFKGSSNQRIIDVQKSLKQGEIVLWDTN